MKGHIDQPVDPQSLQVRLLAERLAVWLYKAKALPLDIGTREVIARFMLERFELRARYDTDRPVFDGVVVPIETDDHTYADCVRHGMQSFAFPPELDVCPICKGATKVCLHCGLPEGSCTHALNQNYAVTICSGCGGTGKEV